uniref:uncharacterized protein LOC122591606 n=1 Tax=Erigeron canadensis TaxID=72917 RepID=UPI001CB8E8B9|nr:uncharacterized protein LOC122591606 [Erigeron canadensis]
MCGFLWSQGVLSKGKAKVKWVHSYKLRGRSFWEVPSRAGISWGWHKLLQLRQSVRPFASSKIGDGKTTLAWHDKWDQDGPLIRFISPRKIARAGFSLQDKVADIISEGTWKWSAAWYDLFPVLINYKVHVINNVIHDKLIWCDGSGNEVPYSASSVWNTIRIKGPEVGWVNLVWFSRCIPRHSFLLWLVMKKKLKTHDRLKPWDVGSATNHNLVCCSLRKTGPDSHSHLFFECSYSAQVWIGIKHLTSLANSSQRWEDILAILLPLSKSNSATSVIARLALAATVYFVWQERNNHMFTNNQRPPEQLIKAIVDTVRLRLVTIKFKGREKLKKLLEDWKVPRSLLLDIGA